MRAQARAGLAGRGAGPAQGARTARGRCATHAAGRGKGAGRRGRQGRGGTGGGGNGGRRGGGFGSQLRRAGPGWTSREVCQPHTRLTDCFRSTGRMRGLGRLGPQVWCKNKRSARSPRCGDRIRALPSRGQRQRFDYIYYSNVVSNELAHIQRPPKTVRSPPNGYPTLASHPTLRRALLLKGALGRRTYTAPLDKPSRQALLHRKSRALQEDGVLDLRVRVVPDFLVKTTSKL